MYNLNANSGLFYKRYLFATHDPHQDIAGLLSQATSRVACMKNDPLYKRRIIKEPSAGHDNGFY